MTTDNGQTGGMRRREMLQCMTWGSAGLLWTVTGGVPTARALESGGMPERTSGRLSFVQISDSHIGFKHAPNLDPGATLRLALDRIGTMTPRPAFMVHTGDVSHLSQPAQFDAAAEIIKAARLETRYIPGEHDTIEDDGKAFFDRFGHDRRTPGGWYSFGAGGVHFLALVNVVRLQAGGLGHLGAEQIDWIANDLKPLGASTPLVVLAHMPLWALYPDWGWGTDDAAVALSHMRRFGSVTVLNGHVHQVMQKIEGNVSFRTAMSTAFPQPAPGQGKGPGPMPVAADRLRTLLGIRRVDFVGARPTIGDTTLAG